MRGKFSTTTTTTTAITARRAVCALALTVAAVTGAVVPAAAHAPRSPAASSGPTSAAYYCGYYSGSALTVYGHTGNRVYEVQCLLTRVGYRLSLDGIFGTATRGAVKDFQQTWNSMTGAHLAVDGKVGSQTWAALRSATG
ncbi:peptidoglycan-binding domain-containing protein [Streptomyces sp. NPDC001340]